MDINEIQAHLGNDFSQMIEAMLRESSQTGKIKRHGDEFICCCPFHEEKNPSFGINEKGLFKCLSCGEQGGFFTFVKKMYGVEAAGAYKKIHQFYRIENDFVSNADRAKAAPKLIEKHLVEEYHSNLLSRMHTETRELLESEWGIDINFITQYKLGVAEKRGNRISIPVYDESGNIVNIRLYAFDPKEREEKGKMISYSPGTGENRLYPIQALQEEEVWICEGEKDTLVARYRGLNAITMTAGANSWSSLFNEKFKDKKVNIVFDLDTAGRDGAARVAHELFEIAKEVRVIELPMDGTKISKDMTDYFMRNGGSKADLESIRDKTVVYSEIQNVPQIIPSIQVVNADTEKIDIVNWMNSENHDKIIKATVTFVGAARGQHHCVPKEVVATCLMAPAAVGNAQNRPCKHCPIGAPNGNNPGGSITKTFLREDRELLKYLDVPEEQIEKDVRKTLTGVPVKCRVSCKIKSRYHIHPNFMVNQYSPILKKGESPSDTTTEAIAYSMNFTVKENNTYRVTASLISLPQNSQAGYMLLDAEPISDFIDTFKLDETEIEALKIFQAEPSLTGVKAKLTEIYDDFRDNVTGIIGREILHMAADVAYHSVLYFDMPGDKVYRGQIDCCIMGDTSTGKNGVIDAIKEHFGIGSGLSGEAVSFAGLIGGVVQNMNRNVVRWGRMPINDRGLVIIDETSGVDPQIISAMSSVRSSGEATIVKAGVSESKTNARCRIIWIANPRDGKNLNENSYPIVKILELFGKPEDVRRLDFACLVEKESGLIERINSVENAERKRVPHKFTSELCRKLCSWAWSRKTEDVFISTEVRNYIYHYAGAMAKDYDSDLSLIEPSAFRIKLAKVAIAIAARLFSTEDGIKLILRKEHVLMAVQFFIEIYASKASRYKEYCAVYQSNMKIKDEPSLRKLIDEIRLQMPSEWPSFVELMTKPNEHYYQASEFETYLGLPSTKVGKTSSVFMHNMTKYGALEACSGRYKRKTAFKQWFAKYLEDLNKVSVENLYSEPT